MLQHVCVGGDASSDFFLHLTVHEENRRRATQAYVQNPAVLCSANPNSQLFLSHHTAHKCNASQPTEHPFCLLFFQLPQKLCWFSVTPTAPCVSQPATTPLRHLTAVTLTSRAFQVQTNSLQHVGEASSKKPTWHTVLSLWRVSLTVKK